MRKWAALLAAAGLAAGCGSTPPTAPSQSSSTTGPLLDLTSGAYQFTLTMSTSGDGAPAFCFGATGSSPDVSAAPVNVLLDRSGDTVVIRATGAMSSLRMDLHLTNGTLLGTASGDYQSKGREVEIEPAFPSGPAGVTGTLLSDRAIGKLNGGVVIDGTGCTNNNHSWTLITQ